MRRGQGAVAVSGTDGSQNADIATAVLRRLATLDHISL